MTQTEMMSALKALALKKHTAYLDKLLPASRAAANAMKDAGMLASAEPLSVALFEIDVIEGEMQELVRNDPATAFPALMELIRRGLA
jgi:hypothetical protein